MDRFIYRKLDNRGQRVKAPPFFNNYRFWNMIYICPDEFKF